MGLDPTTHTLYLPTAEMQAAATTPATTSPGRPTPKPDSFMVVVVDRVSR